MVKRDAKRAPRRGFSCGNGKRIFFDGIEVKDGRLIAVLGTTFPVRGKQLITMIEIARRLPGCRGRVEVAESKPAPWGSRIELELVPDATPYQQHHLAASFCQKFADTLRPVLELSTTVRQPDLYVVH